MPPVLTSAAVVGKESFAAVGVRSGKLLGGDSLFSAGAVSVLIGWLVSIGPSAGMTGSATRLLAANCGVEETLSAVTAVATGEALCVGDC